MTSLTERLDLYNDMDWITMPLVGKEPCRKEWQKLTQSVPLKQGENVGILTGKPSNITVVDIDVKDRGMEIWEQIKGLLDLPETCVVRSGSGGLHYYFTYEPTLKRGARKITVDYGLVQQKIGIDLLNDSSYIVAPPSIHPETKREYEWEISPEEYYAEMPDKLKGLLNGKTMLKYNNDNGEFSIVKQKADTKPMMETKKKINNIDEKQIQEIVMGLNSRRADDRDEWIRVVFAIGTFAREHQLDLKDLAIEFSKQSKKFVSDTEVVEKYESGNTITVATLLFWLKNDNRELFNTLIGKHTDTTEEPLILEVNDNHEHEKFRKRVIHSPLTDDDIAAFFVKTFGANYAVFDERVYMFQKHHWTMSDNDECLYNTLANTVYPDLHMQLNSFDDAEQRAKKAKDLLKLLNWNQRKGIVAAIKAKIRITENKFDNNPDLLGFKNGVYELNTGNFRNGKLSDYITKIVPYDYIPPSDAFVPQREKFMQFLDTVMPFKEERDFLLKTISTCLDGRTLENFIMLTGQGRNGKDTIMTYLLRATIGDALFYNCSPTVITQKKMSGINQEVANMNRKRAIIYNEPNKDDVLQCGTIKSLTGGKTVNARGIYSKETDTVLHGAHILLLNKLCKVDNVDDAFANRLIMIKFRACFRTPDMMATYPEGTPYLHVVNTYYKSQKFLDENKMVFLHLLLEHYKDYREEGYVLDNVPETCKELAKQYLTDSDDFTVWFNSNYEMTNNDNDIIKIKDIFDDFRTSDLYENMSKRERRAFTQKRLREDIKENPTLRMYYRERDQSNGKNYKNILKRYKIKVDVQDERKEDENDEE